MALSENIKARRNQLKMSQEYVANQLGISRQAVAKWESGKSQPAAANLAELAALFEMKVSELTDPETYATRQQAQEQGSKEKRRNPRMLFGRWAAVFLVNIGWDGYSSGLYGTDMPYYWLALLCAGIVLLFMTSMDMGKKHKLQKLQVVTGAVMIFSIFFLPRCIPVRQAGINYLIADIVTVGCVCVLNLKYWRYIWNVK